MLDERERRALAEIETRLTLEDPAFARRMAQRFPILPVLCIAVFLSLPFVAMFAGPHAALITVDVTALLVVLALAVRQVRKRRS